MKYVNDVNEAVTRILNDEIFIYPTDTLFGIGVNALKEKNIQKICEIKKRGSKKPISIAVANISMMKKVACVNSASVQKLIPGPFTFLLPYLETIPKILYESSKKIGVRIPGHSELLKIISKADVPITATSCNISGEHEPKTIEEIDNEILDSVDFILDIKPDPKGVGSTILDLTVCPIKVLRNELFEDSELRKILGVSFEI